MYELPQTPRFTLSKGAVTTDAWTRRARDRRGMKIISRAYDRFIVKVIGKRAE